MPRLVAADASPLIGLAVAGAFDLLRTLYGTLTITRQVKDEVTGRSGLPGAAELEAAMRSGWIRVAPTPLETWRFEGLDAGEASTLALALSLQQKAPQQTTPLVLIDDALGRAQAAELGLETLGVTGVLLAAKRARHLPKVRPLLQRLARRGFTIAESEVHDTLKAAGEAQQR